MGFQWDEPMGFEGCFQLDMIGIQGTKFFADHRLGESGMYGIPNGMGCVHRKSID
jgi:hypothetical protein